MANPSVYKKKEVMISKKKFEDGVLGERSRKEGMVLRNNNNRDEKGFGIE